MFEHLQRLQELIDKNCQNIPEGDYLALCDTTKKIYAHEEDATLAVWSVCMRQAEHDMQTSSCRSGFNPENNPEHEARLRKYEMRRQKYVKKLEDAGFEVPVFVQYDMEEKHLHVTYPEYSSDSDTDEEDNPMLTSPPRGIGRANWHSPQSPAYNPASPAYTLASSQHSPTSIIVIDD